MVSLVTLKLPQSQFAVVSEQKGILDSAAL